MPVSKIIKSICSLILIVSVLTGCLPLMDDTDALRFNDSLPPEISVESPVENTYCANIELVTGRVSDLATKRGEVGKVRSVFYKVDDGSIVNGKAELLPENSFSFKLNTSKLLGNFILHITAVDWNDNQVDKPYSLIRDPKNGIPSFVAIPGNRRVTLQWTPIPHTASYTIYYSSGDSLPSEKYGEIVSDLREPYYNLVMLPDGQQLTNGQIYVFQLQANPEPGWPESRSDYVYALPLSPQTLAPQVTGKYKAIEVSWNPIPGIKTFHVSRSQSQDRDFQLITGKITGTTYLDEHVEEGTCYYYRISPAFEDDAPGSQIAVTSNANGAESSVFPDQPCISHTIYTLGIAEEIVISGYYAYVAAGEGDLQVLDFLNPNPNTPVYTVPLGGNAEDVAVSGNYVYVATGEYGLQIVDISTPMQAHYVCTVDTLGSAETVQISGDYAYVGIAGDADIRVINISNPLTASRFCSIDLEGDITRFAIQDHYAYFAISGSGLHVYDISSPAAIVPRGIIPMPSEKVNDIKIAGSSAYLVDETKYFTIVDISNPSESAGIYTVQLPHPGRRIAIAGKYAYVTTAEYGLHFISIDNPFSAAIVNSVLTPGSATGVAAYGPTVYVADWDAVRAIDTGNLSFAAPVMPLLRGEGAVQKVVIAGSYAYATMINGGLWIIGLKSQYWRERYRAVGVNTAYDVAVSGDYAYVAAGPDGLLIVDLRDPSYAHVIKSAPGYFIGIDVCGDYAYALEGSSMQIINISEPLAASKIGALTKLAPIGCQPKFSNGYAYLANGYDGLTILDVHNPVKPVVITTVDTPGSGFVHDLEIRGTKVYAADGANGMEIIDISNLSDPDTIRIKQTIDTPAIATGITISGFYAFVVDNQLGVQVVDISNPHANQAVNIFNQPAASLASAVKAEVSGNHLFVACQDEGLWVIRLFPDRP